MKNKLLKIIPVLLLFALLACHNQDWEFPDYKFNGTYFAYQSPVRTLVLGDYDQVDNTKDNNLQFSIGVTIGGMYENTKDIKVGFIVDHQLVDNLYNDKGEQILELPTNYYTLSSPNTIIVPKGKFTGFVDVQLTDAFLNDPNSIKVKYVIPLKITSSETDSVLVGNTTKQNPDPRVATDWNTVPMNYTLFAIKYINPWHGKYLHRGKDVTTKNGNVLAPTFYRALYLEQNEIWSLQTMDRNAVQVTGSLSRPAGTTPAAGSASSFILKLAFDNSGNCTITKHDLSPYPVTGTGKFVKNADEFGGKPRHRMILNYTVTDVTNSEVHNITDTLTVRDRDVRLETFTPVVK